MADPIEFRSYRREDRAWVTTANLRFYRNVHGFDASFADALGASLDLLEDQMAEETSDYLVAECAERPVGCIFLSPETSFVARIRLFYLDEAYRRQGIGMRLLREVLLGAARSTLTAVRVSTFDRHPEACRLYGSFGFKLRYSQRSEAFGRVMRQLDYELLLASWQP